MGKKSLGVNAFLNGFRNILNMIVPLFTLPYITRILGAVNLGKYNFASEVKEYKKNPDIYIGHVGDFCEMLRVAVTTLSNTPNLYDILSILGKEEIEKRIKMFEVK